MVTFRRVQDIFPQRICLNFWPREARQQNISRKLSEIGLNIVESTLVSSRVFQSCGRKIFNAAELFHFICSGIERNVEVPSSSTPHKKDSQARIKRRRPSSVSSPDRSPQPRKVIFRNSLPPAPLGNMRKIMRTIIYYD